MEHDTGHRHPVLACAHAMDAALKDVADVDPVFMRTAEKKVALVELAALAARVEELRYRVLAAADDLAEEVGARDAAAWLAQAARLDRSETRRAARLARSLEARWHQVAGGLRGGAVNRAQAPR